MTDSILTIGQFAQLCGLSTHTIRYYESVGVLRPGARASNGHRRYFSGDVAWMEFVQKLKRTGMPLEGIRQYALLREQGEATMQSRLAMLELHRKQLDTQIAELVECSKALDGKMHVYRKALAQALEPTTKVP